MGFDIGSLKRKVLAEYPFFGSLTAGLEYEETEEVRSTAGDGKTLYYNPEYMTGLTEEEQVFALAHEICHVAFDHIYRSEGKDAEVWKAATDAVINQLLKRDGLEIIDGGIDYPEAIYYDAEEYYEILMRNKLEIDLSGGSVDDDHSLWEEAVDRRNEEQKKRDEELLQELENLRDLLEQAENDEEIDEDEMEILAEKISKAGNSENDEEREPVEIGQAGPVIDWRLILRDTIHYGVDWSFTHATIEDGIVRPALEERPMPETEIVIDTSWSVDGILLRSFLRECKNILQHSRMKAECFDTKFYGFHEIKTEQDIDEMVFDGGGGTDFNVAVEAFSLRVDNRIIFTDGEAPMPDMPMDAVWMVYGDEAIEPRGGKVIHITPQQLEKLAGR